MVSERAAEIRGRTVTPSISAGSLIDCSSQGSKASTPGVWRTSVCAHLTWDSCHLSFVRKNRPPSGHVVGHLACWLKWSTFYGTRLN